MDMNFRLEPIGSTHGWEDRSWAAMHEKQAAKALMQGMKVGLYGRPAH
jgi:hypothetical protein